MLAPRHLFTFLNNSLHECVYVCVIICHQTYFDSRCSYLRTGNARNSVIRNHEICISVGARIDNTESGQLQECVSYVFAFVPAF